MAMEFAVKFCASGANDDSCCTPMFRSAAGFFYAGKRGEMFKSFLVFMGGGVGAVFRYLLAGWTYRVIGSDFPYGTLAVNILGCFVIGLFLTVAEGRFLVSPSVRVFVAVGIIGGFTTFSTLNFETLELLRDGAFALALLNIGASIVVGLSATWAGAIVGGII